MESTIIKKTIFDKDWGCTHNELCLNPGEEDSSIIPCVINIDDLAKIAHELTENVLDNSWMLELDVGTQRSYRVTVKETADVLVSIFKTVTKSDSEVSTEFGEIMVSMGASRALSQIFNHISLPISELWKPQIKQNEGFDFHTVCPSFLINFGEAKYSGSVNPHGDALSQISDFIKDEKHLRDWNHLRNFAHQNAMSNLNNDNFGVVAAFSISSESYELIMRNAYQSAVSKKLNSDGRIVYLIGVICR